MAQFIEFYKFSERKREREAWKKNWEWSLNSPVYISVEVANVWGWKKTTQAKVWVYVGCVGSWWWWTA